MHANNDITLSFEDGQIYGVLGENGAGKSTLMKILSGFYLADRGEILVDGRPEHYSTPEGAIQAGIGMLQQDPLDIGPFTVLENFVYGRPVRVQIAAVDSHGSNPQTGVRITVLFKSTAEPRRLLLAEGETGDDGGYTVETTLPAFNGGTSAVVISAQSELGQTEMKHLVHR